MFEAYFFAGALFFYIFLLFITIYDRLVATFICIKKAKTCLFISLISLSFFLLSFRVGLLVHTRVQGNH